MIFSFSDSISLKIILLNGRYVSIIDVFLFSIVDEKKNEISCAFYDEDNCRYAFVYYFEAGHFVVRAQEHRDCPPKVGGHNIIQRVQCTAS